jgi:hypothetical protein
VYSAAASGLRPTYARARDMLSDQLNERAVLGELHRMLSVLEAPALETLRGSARLEWRMRTAQRELTFALAKAALLHRDGDDLDAASTLPHPKSMKQPAGDAPRPRRQPTPAATPAAAAEEPMPVPAVPPVVAGDALSETKPTAAQLAAAAVETEEPRPPVPQPWREAEEPITFEVADEEDSTQTLPSRPTNSEGSAATFAALREAVEQARRRSIEETVQAQARTPLEEVRDARRGLTDAPRGVLPAAAPPVMSPKHDSEELPKVPALRSETTSASEDVSRAPRSSRVGATPTSRWQQPKGSENADAYDAPVSLPKINRERAGSPRVGQRIVEPTDPYRAVAPRHTMPAARPGTSERGQDTANASAVDEAFFEALRSAAAPADSTDSATAPLKRIEPRASTERETASRPVVTTPDRATPPSADPLSDEAEWFARLGDFDRVAAADAWDRLGPRLYEQRRFDEALGALLLLAKLEREPLDARSYLLEAAEVAENQLGDAWQAFELLTKVLKRQPEDQELSDRVLRLVHARGWWGPWFDTVAELAQSSDEAAVRDAYLGLAKDARRQLGPDGADRVRRLYDALSAGTPHLDPVDAALLRAKLAVELLEDPAEAVRTLKGVFEQAGPRYVEVAAVLSEICRTHGAPELAQEALTALIARRPGAEEHGRLALLLSEVLEAQGVGPRQQAATLSEAFAAGAMAAPLLRRLVGLWREAGQWNELLELYAIAAERAGGDSESRVRWLQEAAWIAAEQIEDAAGATEFLEDVSDATSGDPQVLYALAVRFRRSGDRLSEMSALERIVAQGEVAVLPPVEVARLAELQVTRPRGAARAAELLEMLLSVQALDDDAVETIHRILPRIAEEAGRPELHLRWLERQVKRIQSPSEAVVVWKLIVELQEQAEIPVAERMEAIDHALSTGRVVGISPSELASLEVRAAASRAALGQWERAMEHALSGATQLLQRAGGTAQTLQALRIVEHVSRDVRDDAKAFAVLHRGAELGGVREQLLYGRALARTQRWNQAIPVLERLADAQDALSAEELNEVREDLARAYRRAPRP